MGWKFIFASSSRMLRPVFVGLYVDSRPADPMFFVTGVQGMETGRQTAFAAVKR